ncbi:MAG: hypothetical protein IKU43_06955 [Clostridia bacterium]|nr:hypothetical protein [Clostridia bacterium]
MTNEKIKILGDGSEGNPYTSPDGTAGINTALETLTHGGCLELESARYNLDKTVTIETSSQKILGKVWACNTDPNGVFESPNGTKLRLTGKDFPAIRIGDKTNPISGSKVCELGIQGDIPGMDTRALVDFKNPTHSAGICIDKVRCDQCAVSDISFCGLATAVCSSGTAMTDACVFERLNVDGCGNGFWFDPAVSVYSHIRYCVAADTPYYGVYVDGKGKRMHNLEIMSTHFVRNGGAFMQEDGMIPAAVLLKDVHRCEVTHCLFDNPGTFWLYADNATDNGDKQEIIQRKTTALKIIGNEHRIRDNTFCNSSDDSINIEGHGNILIGNICDGNVRIKGRASYIANLVFTKPESRLILEADDNSTVIFGVEEKRIVRI